MFCKLRQEKKQNAADCRPLLRAGRVFGEGRELFAGTRRRIFSGDRASKAMCRRVLGVFYVILSAGADLFSRCSGSGPWEGLGPGIILAIEKRMGVFRPFGVNADII